MLGERIDEHRLPRASDPTSLCPPKPYSKPAPPVPAFGSSKALNPTCRTQLWEKRASSGASSARSANSPRAGEGFHKIGSGRSAFGRLGHLCRDLAGSGDALWRQDSAQVRGKCLPGGG